MKSQLGIPLPERRIGLSAHDFQMLTGIENVILTRAKHLAGAPTLASRWLQRLTTLSGAIEAEKMQMRGTKYLDWAAKIDEPSKFSPPISPPSPCPLPPFAPAVSPFPTSADGLKTPTKSTPNISSPCVH